MGPFIWFVHQKLDFKSQIGQVSSRLPNIIISRGHLQLRLVCDEPCICWESLKAMHFMRTALNSCCIIMDTEPQTCPTMLLSVSSSWKVVLILSHSVQEKSVCHQSAWILLPGLGTHPWESLICPWVVLGFPLCILEPLLLIAKDS